MSFLRKQESIFEYSELGLKDFRMIGLRGKDEEPQGIEEEKRNPLTRFIKWGIAKMSFLRKQESIFEYSELGLKDFRMIGLCGKDAKELLKWTPISNWSPLIFVFLYKL
jgi:hypothetical protein